MRRAAAHDVRLDRWKTRAVSGCCGSGIPSCEAVFDEKAASDDVDRFRRHGPRWATRELIDELSTGFALAASSVIDIGAGVGAVHLGLLERGAAHAVDLDGSSAYLRAASVEAERLGFADRVEHVLGDAVVIGPLLEPADLVALDRVICCFADLADLLGAAAALASQRIGLVYPRDIWWIRVGARLTNPVLFSRSAGFRFRVHRREAIAGLLVGAGFVPLAARDGRLWRVETWERAGTG
jgi:SAM-dependent methyltransferase